MENFAEKIISFIRKISKKISPILIVLLVTLTVIISFHYLTREKFLWKRNIGVELGKFRNLDKILPSQDLNLNSSMEEKYLKYIQLIQNFTENDYIGDWNSTSKIDNFENNYGYIVIRVAPPLLDDLFFDNEKSFIEKNSVVLDLCFSDGYYFDKYMNMNFTLKISDLINHLSTNNNITVSRNNLTGKVSFFEIIDKIDTKGIFFIILEKSFSIIMNINRNPFINRINKMNVLNEEIPILKGSLNFDGNNTISMSATFEKKEVKYDKILVRAKQILELLFYDLYNFIISATLYS